MARVWQLLVRADGDTRAAQREMRKLQRSFKRYGQNLQTAGRHLTYAVTAPVIATAAIGVREMMEQQRATAATNAVLKSTGKIGQISAKHVEDLATKFQNMSGIEDDVIQSSENVLLRFDGINKSNFDTVTQSLADMMAAGKSGAAAATALGVAYTQPEKAGMRLKKLGVVLSSNEEAMIKKLVKHHKVAKAQAIIQERVNKAFGGQAKALGKASPLERIKRLYEDFAETFGKMLLPAIVKFSEWFGKLSERFQQLSPRMQRIIGIGALVAAALGPILLIAGSMVTAIGALLPVIASLINPWTLVAVAVAAVGVAWLRQGNHMQQAKKLFMRVVTYVRDVAWPAMVDSARKAMAWYQSNIAPTINGVVNDIVATLTQWASWGMAFWNKYGDDIMRIVRPAFNLIKNNISTTLKVIGGIIRTVLKVLRGDWKGAWKSLKGIVKDAWEGVKGVVRNGGPMLKNAMKAALKISFDLNEWVASKAIKIGKSVIDGIVDGVGGVGGKIWHAIKSAVGSAFDNVGGIVDKAISLGKKLVSAIVDGLKSLHIPLPHFTIKIKKSHGIPVDMSANVKWYRRGGIVDGAQMVGVGESGPEAIVPLGNSPQARFDRESVMRRSGLNQVVNDSTHSSSVVNNIQVYPQSQDVEAIARRVAYIISSGKVRVAG